MQALIDDVRAMRAEVKRLSGLVPTSAPKPKPALRSPKDLTVDPTFDLAKAPKAAQPLLKELERRVQASGRESMAKGINEVFHGAQREAVWRVGHQYVGGLELPGRILGTAMHVTESARLTDIILPRLVEREIVMGGKRITVWEMRTRGGEVGPDNDKEEAGSFTTLRRLASNMARNLKTHPENEGRVRALKRVIRANETKWLLKKGGDPDWRIPNERTMHTAVARLGGFIRSLSMEDDSGIAREWQDLIAKWTPLIADEFLPYNDHLTGDPCFTWCYNALAATDKRDVKPGSTEHVTDAAHLSVYTWSTSASAFELGLEGLDFFNRADFQTRMGNGLWYALFADRPYKYHVWDDNDGDGVYRWWDGEGDCNMDIAPRDMQRNDSTLPRPQDLPLKGYVTGKRRILRKGNEWRSGENHRKAPFGIEAFPHGQAYLFATDGYKEMSLKELIGTPEKPIITTPYIVSTFAGRAFAEVSRAQGRVDFK